MMETRILSLTDHHHALQKPFGGESSGDGDGGDSDDTDMYIGIAGLVLGLGALGVAIAKLFCGTFTYFILTDRRLIEVNKSGATMCSGKKKFHVHKVWFLKELVSVKYQRENVFWANAFACFSQCVRDAKVQQSMQLTFEVSHYTQHLTLRWMTVL